MEVRTVDTTTMGGKAMQILLIGDLDKSFYVKAIPGDCDHFRIYCKPCDKETLSNLMSHCSNLVDGYFTESRYGTFCYNAHLKDIEVERLIM